MVGQEKIIEKLKRMKMSYLKQERGSILVLSVILLPILFAFLGFGYDFGNIYMHKSRLQNVADAAALAGARAYLDSQATEDKDKIDGTVDRANGKLTANSTATYPEGRNTPDVYTVGDAQKTKNRDYSNHKAADKAADAYIYHNIVNLGSEVKTDKWSHYALNSNGTDPKTFYRIGLYEEVPLYFLPIIKSVKSPQIVRAGAIALVEEKTSGSGKKVNNPSIFDNLFTLSEYLRTSNASDNEKVAESFQGNIVYTHQNGLSTGSYTQSNEFYAATYAGQVANDSRYRHLYKGATTSSLDPNNINDPTVNTFFDTTAYLEAFHNKLIKYHYEIYEEFDCSGGKFYLTGDETYSSKRKYCYYTRVETSGYDKDTEYKYRMIDRVFYRVTGVGDEKTTFCYAIKEGENYKLAYYPYPIQEDRKNRDVFVLCGKKEGDPRYYLIKKNNGSYEVSDKYIGEIFSKDAEWNFTWKQNVNIGIDEIKAADSPYCWVDESGRNDAEKYTATYKTFNRHESDSPSETNVYHYTYANSKNGNGSSSLDITINDALKGDVNKPIYIIIEKDINYVYISGSAEDTRRPIVMVYYGTGNFQLKFTGKTLRATIYAPYSSSDTFEMNNSDQTFYGSVTMRGLYKQPGKSTWIKTNYLENYKADTNTNPYADPNAKSYTDDDIKAATDSIIEKAKQEKKDLTEALKNKLAKEYAKALNRNVDDIKLGDVDWYNKELTYDEKQSLYRVWRNLYNDNDYASIRDFLWPWHEYFNVDGTPSGGLRLINFRTDYQEKNSDGSDNTGEIDPFIYLSLGEENAY